MPELMDFKEDTEYLAEVVDLNNQLLSALIQGIANHFPAMRGDLVRMWNYHDEQMVKFQAKCRERGKNANR